jgi:hypothetical protein
MKARATAGRGSDDHVTEGAMPLARRLACEPGTADIQEIVAVQTARGPE